MVPVAPKTAVQPAQSLLGQIGNTPLIRLAKVDDFERPPYTVVGWGVASIEEAVRTLMAAGVDPHRYDGMGQDDLGIWTAPSQDRVAWFSDSEGNTLSVTQSAVGSS